MYTKTGGVGTDIFIYKNVPGSHVGQGYTVEIFENGVKIESVVTKTKAEAYKYIKDYKDFYHTNRAFQNQLGVHVTFKTKKERGETAMIELDSILYKKAQEIERLLHKLANPVAPVKRFASDAIRSDIVPIPTSGSEETGKEEDEIVDDMFNSLQEYFQSTKDPEATQYNKVKEWLAKVKKDIEASKRMGVEYDLESIADKLKKKFTPDTLGYDIVTKRAYTEEKLQPEPQSPVDVGSDSKVHDLDNLVEYTNKLRDTSLSMENLNEVIDNNLSDNYRTYVEKILSNNSDKTTSESILQDALKEKPKVAVSYYTLRLADPYLSRVATSGKLFYEWYAPFKRRGMSKDVGFVKWVELNNLQDLDFVKDIWTYIKTVDPVNNIKIGSAQTIFETYFLEGLLKLAYVKTSEISDTQFLEAAKTQFNNDVDTLLAKALEFAKSHGPQLESGGNVSAVESDIKEYITQDTEFTGSLSILLEDFIKYGILHSCSKFLLSDSIIAKLKEQKIRTSEGVLKFLISNYGSFKIKSTGGIEDFGNILTRILEEKKQSSLPNLTTKGERIIFNTFLTYISNQSHRKINALNLSLKDVISDNSYKKEIQKIIESDVVPLLSKTGAVVVKPDGTVIVDNEKGSVVEEPKNSENKANNQDVLEVENNESNSKESPFEFLNNDNATSTTSNTFEKEESGATKSNQETEELSQEKEIKPKEKADQVAKKKSDTILLDILWM